MLTYGTDGNGKQTGFFIYDVWDPSAGTTGGGHLTLPNITGTDIFCSSQMICRRAATSSSPAATTSSTARTTNTGNNNSNVFNPPSNSLARGNNMNRARWYSTSTTLLNGEIYVQGGTGGGDLPGNPRHRRARLRLLSNANTSGYSRNVPAQFPRARRTRLRLRQQRQDVLRHARRHGPARRTAGQLPGATSWTASAAMFQPGRIIQMGGASSAALVIDINGAQPVVTSTQSMSTQRQWVSATVLPDGRCSAPAAARSRTSSPA